MKKQLLKGLAMLMAIMALALATAVASANGQSVETRAHIPFQFAVGDHNLTAGAYRLCSITPAGDALRIDSRSNTKVSAMQRTMPASGQAKQAMLVFHRYGERYFLAEVWSSATDGRRLLPSRQERAIQKELSRIAATQPAQKGTGQCNCEIVEIALGLQ
jgi:hypothetical protein